MIKFGLGDALPPLKPPLSLEAKEEGGRFISCALALQTPAPFSVLRVVEEEEEGELSAEGRPKISRPGSLFSPNFLLLS